MVESLLESKGMENTINEGQMVVKACGHSDPCPSCMGRGQARARRIAEWASLACKACREAKIRETAARLTSVSGELVPDAVREAWIARRMAQVW